MNLNQLHFSTKALHMPFLRKDPHGSLQMPIYDCVAFEFDSAEEIEQAFLGKKPRHTYSRITNPTVEHFERKMQILTDSFGVAALSSGMAAIANLFIAIAGNGDNIITSKHLFGNTYSLFEKTLRPWGLETRYADLTQIEEIDSLIDDHTQALFFETITNPQLEVVDVKKLSELTHKHQIVLIADTTTTPPYLFSSKEWGVDIEVLSSTKFISGGATSVGGVIIDNGTFDWRQNSRLSDQAQQLGPGTLLNRLKREVYRNLGACLSPHNAYLHSLGLETMALRANRACENTLAMAEFLCGHSKIASVHYPGLPSSPFHSTAQRQFRHGAGALLTFDLASKPDCFKFMNALQIIKRATNLNDNKTLIIHPASTIFCEYDPALKAEMGVRETMLRLAVGIEDVSDLINDIQQALEVL